MNPLPDLRTWLAEHAADSATLTLGRHEVKLLNDELQRLRQSNEMLRKQNKKVRGKVARLRGNNEGVEATDGAEDAEDAAGGKGRIRAGPVRGLTRRGAGPGLWAGCDAISPRFESSDPGVSGPSTRSSHGLVNSLASPERVPKLFRPWNSSRARQNAPSRSLNERQTCRTRS